jgi:hypothetical protein
MHSNSGNADAHRADLAATGPPTTQPSREEAIRLMRNGLAKAMRDVAASYVMPTCWITARDRKPLILDSASTFLDFPRRIFS